PTSVNLVASTFTNGAFASVARRRAISVLPTPVGPIIRMFLGVTSLRNAGSSCIRRQRSRSAIATARLALCWPMMKRSSSLTISRGVNSDMSTRIGNVMGIGKSGGLGESIGSQRAFCRFSIPILDSQLFDRDVVVGVDADVAGDPERLLDDLACLQVGVVQQRLGRGLRVRTARADRDQAVLGFQHVAVAGNQK